MSVSSSLDLCISGSMNFSILATIKQLLCAGWGFNYEGAAFYLPIGDEDDFDWQCEALDTPQLLEILSKKEALGELVGVAMTWKETGIGGEFHFRKNGTVAINLSLNRKVTSESITDVSWYINKIIPVINGGEGIVESFIFSEHV